MGQPRGLWEPLKSSAGISGVGTQCGADQRLSLIQSLLPGHWATLGDCFLSPGGIERQHTSVSSILPPLLFKAKKESPKPKFQEAPGNQEGGDVPPPGQVKGSGGNLPLP